LSYLFINCVITNPTAFVFESAGIGVALTLMTSFNRGMDGAQVLVKAEVGIIIVILHAAV
jgi:hypothetical protein